MNIYYYHYLSLLIVISFVIFINISSILEEIFKEETSKNFKLFRLAYSSPLIFGITLFFSLSDLFPIKTIIEYLEPCSLISFNQ